MWTWTLARAFWREHMRSSISTL